MSYYELVCSTELTGGKHSHLIGLSALNILLSITAFLWNTLILVALHKESSLHPPSKLLFRNLATTDLCVGIIVEPLSATYFISALKEWWDICRFSYVASLVSAYILGSVSLFTLTAVSLDRLLALLLGLRYRQVVSLKRTYLILFAVWIVSVSGTAMHFWKNLITVWYGAIGVSLCLITSFFSYAKIFRTLHLQQSRVQVLFHRRRFSQSFSRTLPQNRTQLQVQRQPGPAIPSLNIERYRKTVSSALWVQLTLLVCFLPYGIIQALVAKRGHSPAVYLPKAYLLTLLYVNSSLNPILYCWKIKEVRKAAKDTVTQLYCSSS